MTAKTFELAPGYTISRLIRGGWQLAGGHGAIDREPGDDRHDRLRRRRHHDLRLRRHLHRRRGADRRLPRRGSPATRPRCRGQDEGPHQVRARPRTAAAHRPPLRRGDHRPVAAAAGDRASRPGAVPLVGLRPCPAMSRRRTGSTAAARGQDRASRRHQFRHATLGEMLDAGIPLVSHAAAVFAARPAGPPRPASRSARDARRRSFLCYGTVAGGFLSRAGSARRSPPDAARQPLAGQVQADHRRFRRLGPVPGAAAQALEAIARRHGVGIAAVASALGARPAAGRRRHRRRALRRACLANARHRPRRARRR